MHGSLEIVMRLPDQGVEPRAAVAGAGLMTEEVGRRVEGEVLGVRARLGAAGDGEDLAVR
jgi:hypothetical protein